MRSLQLVLPVISATLLLQYCGKAPAKLGKNPNNGGGLTDEIGAEEMEYSWDDLNCVNGSGLSATLTKFEGTSWQGAKPTNTSLSIPGLVNSRGQFDYDKLEGNVQAREIYSRTCSTPTVTCTDSKGEDLGWSLSDSRGLAPRFCNKSGKYTRDSLERISLQSVKNFNDGKQNITKQYQPNDSYMAIDLKVMPRFETKRFLDDGTGTVSVIVNQMAYFPVNNSQAVPFISVFPQRKGSDESTPRLWEASFVFSHELGHHLESNLGIDHFNEKRTLVRMAVSEGFADLVGFTSLNLDEKELSNIPCLSDRRVTSSSFSDGVAKIVDRALMNALTMNESSKVNLASSNVMQIGENLCATPNRTAPHGLGALIAHNVYKFANKTFMIADVKPTAGSFAKFFKQWMTKLESVIGSGTSITTDLEEVAKAIEATVVQDLSDRNVDLKSADAKKLCAMMTESFSALSNKSWFNQSSCTSL